MTFKAIDLFCGCGGLSAGLMESGIDVVGAFDRWDTAVATYNRNLSDHAQVLDLSKAGSAIPQVSRFSVDMIAGGPPCQDFSTAGKRIEAGQANLTMAFGSLLLKCKPDFFLMENVPPARLSQAYQRMAAQLKRSGYEIAWAVLDASLCGVPQKRRRFFAFGSLHKQAPARWLTQVSRSLAPEPLTVKKYLGRGIRIRHYYRHPRNYSRRSVFSVHEPSPTVRGVNRPVPPNYKGNHLDRVPPAAVRPLTTRERSRIQTFPASWKWDGGDRNADAELQIGNAVPVNLARFVGRACILASQ